MELDVLTGIEARILGALAEKAMATPNYYPMTANSLVAACNQKTSRWPVTDFAENEIESALRDLMRVHYVSRSNETGRVPKYLQLLDAKYELNRGQLALLTVLMLRGPQTSGELRGRTGRLYDFGSVEEVEGILNHMAGESIPLVVRLPRQQGRREERFAHLLCGPVELSADDYGDAVVPSGRRDLAAELDEVRRELEALRAEFTAFKGQFD